MLGWSIQDEWIGPHKQWRVGKDMGDVNVLQSSLLQLEPGQGMQNEVGHLIQPEYKGRKRNCSCDTFPGLLSQDLVRVDSNMASSMVQRKDCRCDGECLLLQQILQILQRPTPHLCYWQKQANCCWWWLDVHLILAFPVARETHFWRKAACAEWTHLQWICKFWICSSLIRHSMMLTKRHLCMFKICSK